MFRRHLKCASHSKKVMACITSPVTAKKYPDHKDHLVHIKDGSSCDSDELKVGWKKRMKTDFFLHSSRLAENAIMAHLYWRNETGQK